MFVFRLFSLCCCLFLSRSRTKLIWWLIYSPFQVPFSVCYFICWQFSSGRIHPCVLSPPSPTLSLTKLPGPHSWLFGFALWSTGLIQGHSRGVRCKPTHWQMSNSPVTLSPKNCLPPAATGCCWFSWWDRDNWVLYPRRMRESSLAPALREKPQVYQCQHLACSIFC